MTSGIQRRDLTTPTITRTDFTAQLSQSSIDLSDIPDSVSEALSASHIDPSVLRDIAGADGVIQGEELGRLYDEICARNPAAAQRSGDIDAVTAVYRALREQRGDDAAQGTGTADGATGTSRRSVGLRRELNNERRSGAADADPAPTDSPPPPPPPPPVPEGWEGRTRQVGREAIHTQTRLDPADLLRVQQMAALPPAPSSATVHGSVRSYLDAIDARDRAAELEAGGHRREAQQIQRPDGVSADQWALTRALQIEGISTQDVESYLATGQLPDLLDDDGSVVMSGADRMRKLEQEATQQGSWTATNTFTFIVEARRSAMAAERQAMQGRLDGLAVDDPLRPEIQTAITASTSLDRDLGRMLQSIYSARTYSAERGGRTEIERAEALDRQAAEARTAGDTTRADQLTAQAQSARDRGARIAQSEGDYRVSMNHFDSTSADRLAARAQIETGQGSIAQMSSSSAPIPEQMPAELGHGDATTTKNGVAGAGFFLERSRARSADGGHNQEQLGLETAHQGAIAQYNDLYVQRSGYSDRVTSDGHLPADRTASANDHRRGYFDARAEQSRLIMERIGLYGPPESLSYTEATTVATLQAQQMGIQQELNGVLGQSLSTDRQLSDQQAQVQSLEEQDDSDGISDAETRADQQDSASDDERSSAGAVTRVFQTSGGERRDYQQIDDANTAQTITRAQVAVSEGQEAEVGRELADARDVARGLTTQSQRDKDDAQLAMGAITRTSDPNASVTDFYESTRRDGDTAAQASQTALVAAEQHPPKGGLDDGAMTAIASTRLDVARYWTSSAEADVQAYGDSGRDGAIDRLDTANILIDAADAARQALPDGDDRRDLATGVVRERSTLAQANADYRPGISRNLLMTAEDVANNDLAADPDRMGEARAEIGSAAIQSAVRHNARFEQVLASAAGKNVSDGTIDDTADDDMYGQAHRLLDRPDLPDNPMVKSGRELLGRVDQAFDRVPDMLGAASQQIQNGFDLSAAQTRTMSYAEGQVESAKMSSVITGGVWLLSFGQEDMKDDVQSAAEDFGRRLVAQNADNTAQQRRGASDLAAGFSTARADGHAFQFLNSIHILSMNSRPGGNLASMDQINTAREFLYREMPPSREQLRLGAFLYATFPGSNDGNGIPVARALTGSVLDYDHAYRLYGDRRMAVITFNQQDMMKMAGDSLKESTKNMWWYVGINAFGEIALGLVLTGGLGSAAAVGETAEIANTARTGLQAAETAETISTLSRISSAIATFRELHPVVNAMGTAVVVGSAMAGANYAAGRIFGRNSAAASFVQVAGNFIPMGASSRAAGLASVGRRAVTIGEEGVVAASRGVSWAAIREGLSVSSLIGHARFYGPQFAMAGLNVAGSTLLIPRAAQWMGVERSELAQAAMGVMLNAFVAGGFASVMSTAGRRAASNQASERLVEGLINVGEGEASDTQRQGMQRSTFEQINSFNSRTSGRMPTLEETGALRAGLIDRLGIDPNTPAGQRQAQIIDGAVEGMRTQRAAELGITGAIREQRTGRGASTRDQVGAMITPDEISPSRPPTRELVQRAVDIAAERIMDSRGGQAQGASRPEAYRDASRAIAAMLHGQALREVEANGRSPYAESLLRAESYAGDRAAASDIATMLQAPGRNGEPPIIGSREAARLEPFLQTELGRARETLDATRAGQDMQAYWSDVRARLGSEAGMNDQAADAALRTMQGQVYQEAIARRVVAAQAVAGDAPLTNDQLMTTARQTAERMGYSADAQTILARDLVQSRPLFEQTGMIRPGQETVNERAFREFRANNQEIADGFLDLSADQFVRAFGETPNPVRLGELAASQNLHELARTDPEAARSVLEASDKGYVDYARIATDRGGEAAATLARFQHESPAGLAILAREMGGVGNAIDAIVSDPGAATTRARALVDAHVAAVDPHGTLNFHALSGTESTAALGRTDVVQQRNIPNAPQLSATELARRGVEPRWSIDINGERLLVSDPFQMPDNRTGVVGYLEHNGRLEAHFFYRSNSQSAWRTSDASVGNGHFGKGLGEADTSLPIELTAALHRMTERGTSPTYDPANHAALGPRAGERIFRGLVPNFTREELMQRWTNQTYAPPDLAGHSPHYYTPEYAATHNAISVGNHTSDVRSINGLDLPDPATMQAPPPHQLPDFSQPPVDTFQFHSNGYQEVTGNGDLTGMIYNSRDGKLRYLLVRDSEGRVGVVGAEKTDSPLTRWGNRRDYVDLHGMDAPLFEYGQQISTGHGGDQDNGFYQLNWNYVRETPIVQEYYHQQGIAPPESTPETGMAVRDVGLPPNTPLDQIVPRHVDRAMQGLLAQGADLGLNPQERGRAQDAIADLRDDHGVDGARFIVRMTDGVGVHPMAELLANGQAETLFAARDRFTAETLAEIRQLPMDQRALAVERVARGEPVQGPGGTQGQPPPDAPPPVTPPPAVGNLAPAPDSPLRRPAGRHDLLRVNERTVAKEWNTVIEPGVDVAGDVRAINEGRAERIAHDRWRVNGRTYGQHDGTLYPIEGQGLHKLDRESFKALAVYNKFGLTDRAETILDRRGTTADQRRAAQDAWRAGHPNGTE